MLIRCCLFVLVELCLRVLYEWKSCLPVAIAGWGSHLVLTTSLTTSALMQIWPSSVHMHERRHVCVCSICRIRRHVFNLKTDELMAAWNDKDKRCLAPSLSACLDTHTCF